MYSIALLMALTGGSEVSDGHRHGGCGGCGGGCGGYVASCGCYGGGRHHGHRHGRHGGGCCGYQSCGNGCGYGGCGNGCGSGCGYQASCGCCGNVAPACGCYGGGYGAPYQGMPAPAPAHPEQIKPMPAPKSTTWNAAPATIVVELPADATLTVDGAATASASNVRVLVSPELTYGKVYEYTLAAKVVREGKTVQVEKNVVVRAGEESRVSMTLPVATVAAR